MAKRIFLVIVALLLALVVALVAILASERGTRFVINRVLLPRVAHLSIAKVQGQILGQLRLQQLHFENAEFELDIPALTLEWRPLALLLWQCRVDQLTVSQLQLRVLTTTASPSSAKPALGALHWPLYWPALVLKQLQIGHTTLQLSPTQTLSWQKVQTSLRFDHHSLAWDWRCLAGQYGIHTPIDFGWQIHGLWQDYQVLAQFSDRIGLPWEIRAHGDMNHVALQSIYGGQWPVQTALALELSWLPQLQLTARLRSQSLNLASWFAAWPSRLNFDLEAAATFNPQTWLPEASSAVIHHCTGQLRSLPLTISGRMNWRPQRWQIERFYLQSAAAEIHLDGVIAANTHVAWQVKVPRLAELLPGGQGVLMSTGVMQSGAKPTHIEAHAVARGLAYDTWAIEQAAANFVFRADQQFQLQLSGRQWHWDGLQLQQLQLDSGGQYQQHSIAWLVQSSLINASGRLLGGFDAHSAWQGVLQQALIQVTQQGTWRLHHAVPLRLSKEHIELPQALCLQQGRQQLCGQGNWQSQGPWRAMVTAKDVTLDGWSVVLPEAWRLQGVLQMEASLEGRGAQVDMGVLSFKAKALEFIQKQAQDLLHYRLGAVRCNADMGNHGARASWDIAGALGHWFGNAQWPQWRGLTPEWRKQAFSGTLTGRLASMTELAVFLPQVKALQGRLMLNMRWDGTMQAPNAQLDLSLRDASTFLPDYNIRLKPISLNVMGDPWGLLAVTGSVQSGLGQIKLEGQLDQVLTDPRLDLNARGQNFLAVGLASYQITASPDIRLVYQAKRVDLSGAIHIPKAELRLVDYQKKVISLSNDVVYVDAAATPVDFFSDIRLSLGDQVQLQYGGLKGRLTGQVMLHDQPTRPTSGAGQINLVDATYNAYGQSFAIHKGEAHFDGGAVTNPRLAVEATRTLTNVVPVTENGTILQNPQVIGVNDELTVGMAITGPLKNYQLKLFSLPPGLSQADILSYLVLGRPTSEVTGSSAQMLMSAASLLGSSGGGGTILQLQQQLKNTFGLEVDVGGTSQYSRQTQTVTQNTSVILGKALSPRLFLGYSIGIVQPVNVLSLKYKISPRWSAQTESSVLGSGGDLFYTINRK